jgi:hypothetical protein
MHGDTLIFHSQTKKFHQCSLKMRQQEEEEVKRLGKPKRHFFAKTPQQRLE